MAVKYGSDLISDLLQEYEIPFAALNPGSSFRGLHDSLVNYGKNRPELIQCTHEEIAVQIAHGYSKATGKPMAAILHNLVGLLHGAMAIYYAYIDRAPVMILGATGPVEVARRRPYIDWIHTAAQQGDAIRDYVKWDYQPTGPSDVVASFARAYRIATSQPQGPTYLCYDAGYQEDEFDEAELNALIDPAMQAGSAQPTRFHGDPAALDHIADLLVNAKRPVLAASQVGRSHEAVAALIELAELLGAPVVEGGEGERMSFPTVHPLNALGLGGTVLPEADVVLALDVRHLNRKITSLNKVTRITESLLGKNCRVLEIGLGDLGIGSWSQEFGPVQSVELSVIADTSTAIPELVARVRARQSAEQSASAKERFEVQAARQREIRAGWKEEALRRMDEQPIATSSFVHEIGEAISGTDWVLTANTVHDWARRLWPIERPDQHPGGSLGTATQFGISLGVALAYRGTDRLVVDIQPDGDLLFDTGAMWTAAYHKIPLLTVMFNNRAYYNDWEHQILMAKTRGRDERMAYLGMEIDKPAPDFAGIARSFGWYAEGPIENSHDIRDAVRRAREIVLTEQRPALVDIVTQHQ